MDAFLPDDYWQKVGQNGKERCRKRPTDRPSPKNLAGVSIAQPHALSSLLLVLVTVKGKEGIPGLNTMTAPTHTDPTAVLSLYYALPPTLIHPALTPLPPPVNPTWDTGNQEELQRLMSNWPHTTSVNLGKTAVV
ncbi:uncharacterized protein LOC125141425 [Tachysurus ichikawai]